MAGSFVGAEKVLSSGAVTTLTCDVHADTLDGDFMVASYTKDDPSATVLTPPAGWTLLSVDYYWRVARDEPASYTFTTNIARTAVLSISVYRGVDTLAAIADYAGQAILTPGTAHPAPALTFPSGDYILVAGVETDGGDVTFTPPAGYTEAVDGESGDSGTSGVGHSIAYKIVTAQTNAAAASFTSSASVPDSGTLHVALRVAGDAAAGVYADWGADGFNQGSNDSLSSNVIAWTIQRGAGAEITSQANPGSATLTLKNPSDLYNPRNASGALYGLLRDGVPIWIGVNSDGALTGASARGLFGGRITDITLNPSPGRDEPATVDFVCEDALGWYQRTPVVLDYAEGRAHDALREAALLAAGEFRYDLAHEIHTMPLSHAEGNLSTVLRSINAINGTRHLAKPEDYHTSWYTYTTRNRQWRLDGTADAELDAAADHVTGTDGWRQSADTVTNRQRATVTPVVFTPGTFTVWEADALPFSVTENAPYSRVVEFDDVVRDATLDIAYTGDTVTSTFEPFATGGKITLTVGAGDEATVTALSVEGRLARRLEGQGYEANETTSQAAPRGIRAGSEIGNEYLGVIASARGIAEHVVWRYADPQLRPTLTVENWMPEQFDLDLYDVIAFTSTHLGMDAVLFEIVGLTHEGRVASSGPKHHITTYVLQECRVQSDPGWFVLDTSELDSADVLAY